MPPSGKMRAKSTYLFLLLPYLKPDLFQMWAVTKFSSERISDVIFVLCKFPEMHLRLQGVPFENLL